MQNSCRRNDRGTRPPAKPARQTPASVTRMHEVPTRHTQTRQSPQPTHLGLNLPRAQRNVKKTHSCSAGRWAQKPARQAANPAPQSVSTTSNQLVQQPPRGNPPRTRPGRKRKESECQLFWPMVTGGPPDPGGRDGWRLLYFSR